MNVNTELHSAFVNAVLADGAYVEGLRAGDQPAAVAEKLERRLTASLATYVANGFRVVTQFTDSDSLNGFSATVFQERASGQRFIAFRGMEDITYFGDSLSAANVLLLTGLAGGQTISMVNWYLRAITTQGAPVIQLLRTIHPIGLGEVANDTYWGVGDGTLVGTPALTLAGHSLGGHLATVFARLFPAAVAGVNTYNGLGVGRLLTDGLLRPLENALGLGRTSFPSNVQNFYAEHGVNFATNDLLVAQLGERVPIFNESGFLTPSGTPNHLLYKLSDALAVYDVLGTIDDRLSIADATKILNAAAATPVSSLETVLDALRELYGPSDFTPTLIGDTDDAPSRDDYHRKLSEFRALVQGNGQRTVSSLVGIPREELSFLARAENGAAYRYALRALSPFAVLESDDLYAGNASLRLYADAVSTPEGMTDAYIGERAQMAAFLMIGNTNDTSAFASNLVNEQVLYRDLVRRPVAGSIEGKPTELNVFLVGGTPNPRGPNTRVVAFGTASSDVLQGRQNVDRLYGASGSDAFLGGAANDYLEGGAGADLYQYNFLKPVFGAERNDGNDTILDTDARGVVRVRELRGTVLSELGFAAPDEAGTMVIAGTFFKDANATNLWNSVDGKVSLLKMPSQGAQGAPTSDLVVTFNQPDGSQRPGSITIKEWNEGSFGIRLLDAPTDPEVARTLAGDFAPLRVGDDLQYDLWGNVVATADLADGRADDLFGHDDGDGDYIQGDGGADTIFGDTSPLTQPGPRTLRVSSAVGGADWIDAGGGDDDIDAGPGADVVEGSFGSDIAQGGPGNDRIYGTGRVALDEAIRRGETVSAVAPGGTEFLMGGAGDDWLVGGDDTDVLLGGADSDIVVGGAGGDTLYGDADAALVSRTWTITRVADDNALLRAEFTGVGSFSADPAAGGSDTLYGGAGPDWIFAGGGADYVNGGSGDDKLLGEGGSDILLGGAGDDVIAGDSGNTPPASAGDDYLDGGEGWDVLNGGGGDDILIGGAETDQLFGADGNDILWGGPGRDELNGGSGKDVYFYNRGDGEDSIHDPDIQTDSQYLSSVVLGDGIRREDVRFLRGSLIVDLGQGDELHFEDFDWADPASAPAFGSLEFVDGSVMTWDDVLAQGIEAKGTEQSDFIVGTGIKDLIEAQGGDDTIDALSGDDVVDAGDGADRIFAGAGKDVVLGGSGDDYLDLALDDDEGHGGGGADFVTGGPGNDIVYGDAGDDILSGDEGDDVLIGGAGDDELQGGTGADAYVLRRGDGHDSIVDSSGANTLAFQAGTADPLSAAQVTVTARHDDGGTLSIVADYGGDAVTIRDPFAAIAAVTFTSPDTTEAETLTVAELIEAAHTPSVELTGTDRKEILDGGFADDVLDGGAGDDVLYGLWGEDKVQGGIGDDRMYGDRGDDRLYGEAGNDTLEGGEGNDSLVGGIGTNTLRGGPGGDEYVLDDDSMQLIEEDGTPGIETIRLAAGRSMETLGAYRVGDDLALTDFAGGAAAYVRGFFNSPASKTWVLAGDLEAPRDLRLFVEQHLADAGDEFAQRRNAFEIGLRGDLAMRGGHGESLGGLQDFRYSTLDSEYLDYRFTGLTADSVNASGGDVLLPSSETESRATQQVGYTRTMQFPVYSIVELPGRAWNVMPTSGATGVAYPAGSNVTQNADGSFHIQEPASNRSVQSGIGTVTQSFNAFATRIERSFTLHQVTGSDAAERFIMAGDFDADGNFHPLGLKNFRGSIAAGGGDDVIFTPVLGLDDYGDYSESSPLALQGRGALIDGGVGNDVIGGSNGADDIVLGEGDDLVDGGAGGDTYYAPFSGGGNDLVYDSAHPTGVTFTYGGVPPDDVLAFAPGVTLENLRYRVTDGRTAEATDDFHRYRSSDIQAVAPASALRTLELDWGTDTVIRVIDSRGRAGVWGGIGIERYRFADGTTLSREQLLAQATRIDNPVITGGPGDETLAGTPGDDTFVIGAGGGIDVIKPGGGFDTLSFGEGISPADVSLGLGSLLLRIGTSGDLVHIEGFDPERALEPGAIARYVFADGSEFTHAELLARGFDVPGGAGDDTLGGTSLQDRMRGGPGNDLLAGGAGDDTYYFDAGDGADQIVDTGGYDSLLLGAGLGSGSVTVRRGDGKLRLLFSGGDAVTIDWDPAADQAIEFVVFGDGVWWDQGMLEAHAVGNQPPVAADDAGTVLEDGRLVASGDALANDSDPDVDTTLQVASPGTFAGSYGSLFLAEGGAYRYELSNDSADVQALREGQQVADDFDYLVSDGVDSSPGTIRIRVIGANDAPITVPDNARVSEDDALLASGNVLGNDSDADAGTLLTTTAAALTGAYGTAVLATDGRYTYTLANGSPAVQSLGAGETAVEAFAYAASDGMASTPGALTITVEGANDAPTVAHPLADQSIAVGTPFVLPLPANMFTDVDHGDTLAYSARRADGSALPAWLTFDAKSGAFHGTPTDAGTLELRVTATDRIGAQASDQFSISVAAVDRSFDFQADGVWPRRKERVNVGSPGTAGTSDEVSIAGKNRSRAVYGGGAGSDTVNGTNGADALLLDDETNPRIVSIETISMGAGDDVVDLTSTRYLYGDVTLAGGAGDDVLWANAGNDRLDGGAGDDQLAGGAGNDVYVHDARGGSDLIAETQGADTILFGTGISPRAVSVGRHGKDLVLSAGTSGSVTVRDWFRSRASRVETVQFADGTVWREAELAMRATAGEADHDSRWPGAERRRDPWEAFREEPWMPQGAPPARDASHLIAALLERRPKFDFSALTAYMPDAHDARATCLSPAEIEKQWRLVQRHVGSLIDHDHFAEDAAGRADDSWHATAAGWGYDGSVGQSRAMAGMSVLQGLSEGFRRLG